MSGNGLRSQRPGDLFAVPVHGPAGPAELRDGVWVRRCLCGSDSFSSQDWQHVPALFDHLATVPRESLRAG